MKDHMLDLSRLTPEERLLWDRTFPDGFEASINEENGPGLLLWSYGYICGFELGYMPQLLVNKFEELDLDLRQPTQYLDNVVRARKRGDK